MNNIQYFSNGVRRFQSGGPVKYTGIPAASKSLDQQYLNDIKRWQNGEIEWNDAMTQYYTNVSKDAQYNKSGKQWQQVNSDVKAWETPGARDSEGRISLPAVTVTARRNSNQMRDIYGIPENYTESERNFIRGVQERPNYKGIAYGMDAAAAIPFLLAVSGLGAGSSAIGQATRTLGSSQANIPASLQYFSSQPISAGTRMALTANGTAVAIPSISVNTSGLMTTLGANTLLGKLLYDGTMNATGNAYARTGVGFNRNVEHSEEQEAAPVNPQPNPEKPKNNNEDSNNSNNKFDNIKKWGKWAWKWGKLPLIGYGIYSAYNVGRQVGSGNERLGNPSKAAEQTIQQLNGNPVTQDTVTPLSTDKILDQYDSLWNNQKQFETDTL